METVFSSYLQSIKGLLQQVLHELLEEYEYVSILATDCVGKSYVVSNTEVSVSSNSMTNERGIVIKVYDKGSYAEYATDCIKVGEITEMVQRIKENLIEITGDLNLALIEFPLMEEKQEQMSYHSTFELDPREVGDQSILNKLRGVSQKGIEFSDLILDCQVVFEYLQVNKLFLSPQKDLEQSYLSTNGVIAAIARKENIIKSHYGLYSALGGAEIIEQMLEEVEAVCHICLELLSSESITPGVYEVICDADVSGLIAHEAFGHGVEMDMFVKDRALAKQYVGKQVASELVTMRDGARSASQVASYFFDDEGVVGQDTVIIDKGILKGGICDSQTAMLLNTPSTGNGRRQSYDHKAYTRMTNTYFEPGTSTLEEMIESIEDGILLQSGASGMEDPKNWGIQCMVNIGREIKNGKLTGKIYSPIILTGYVPDLLKSISMVSNHLVLSGVGFCGKGYKEWVKVSTGGPAIKAKVRLG